MAALMISANLPDVDVIGLFFGENLAWRRGWTHGPIALVLLPLILTLLLVLFDRWQARRGSRPAGRLPVRPGWLLALCYIGIASHPLLDFLNSYGIRCLMPFSDRWFYGDALFIIDLWVWATLGLSIWLSIRRERRGQPRPGRPALWGLVAVALYSGAMGLISNIAAARTRAVVEAQGNGWPERVVANPVPIDPFRRRMVYQLGDSYGFGDYRLLADEPVTLEPDMLATNMADPAIADATAQDKEVADFLYWSRLPFATVKPVDGGREVVIGDARYHRSLAGSRFQARTVVPD